MSPQISVVLYHMAKTSSVQPAALSMDFGAWSNHEIDSIAEIDCVTLFDRGRYTARALHHILEEKYEGKKWPSQRFAVPSQVDELAQHIMERQNSASAPYQMVRTGNQLLPLPSDADVS